MFEWQWVDGLDAREALGELARVRDLLLSAEAGQFLLAARWADLNAPDYVEGLARQLPGMPKAVRVSEDCPELDEFAGAELAAVSGLSTQLGERLIADALLVRHRHPRLWEAVGNGTARVWVASKVARRCAAAELDAEQAAFVDAATTPYVESLTPGRFLALVEAKIIEADPQAAEARARARALERFVRSGPTDENGLKTLIARAHAGDVTVFCAVLDRIAVILAAQGDPTPLEVRRASALRILANPARALALLTGATLEHLDPHIETVEDTGEGLWPEHPAATEDRPADVWMRDETGRDVAMTLRPEPPTEPDTEPDDQGSVGSSVVPDADLLREVLDALARFDPKRLDPLTVFHVHLTDTSLRAGQGVLRVEDLGPHTLGMVHDWLVHPFCSDWIRQQIRVRPVLDADAVHPVDAYEWPTDTSELATGRNPYEVFPYGTRTSRHCEDDHVIAFRPGRKKQTRITNNAKLGKRHHRIKTFGGWHLFHPEPGLYLWRTRHGHWLRVDTAGTHHLGPRPDLDAHHLDQAATA